MSDPHPEDRDADPESVARAILLRQLTLGRKSRHQLATKLRERNVPEEAAEAVLERFEEVGLVDDAEFAALWVSSRSGAKALSRSALRRELATKGITGAPAEEALATVSMDEEDDAARLLVERRRREVPADDRAAIDREVRRLVGMLARKGHSPGRAFRIVSEVLGSDSVNTR
ncbi:regulatory protein RecX [Sinomonas sp. ASV322]|uniref:regulatory protein RecX n=1 Tax=Sinomonas sp. ASV322 TaxID=3041920 RepID=UPI0027DCB0B2|nr:regulatory protein RecX [Sinomonas sp. ASV322]MDQ4502676.1 regulatory protein RecX [Sinomonas sp. ASV322]